MTELQIKCCDWYICMTPCAPCLVMRYHGEVHGSVWSSVTDRHIQWHRYLVQIALIQIKLLLESGEEKLSDEV